MSSTQVLLKREVDESHHAGAGAVRQTRRLVGNEPSLCRLEHSPLVSSFRSLLHSFLRHRESLSKTIPTISASGVQACSTWILLAPPRNIPSRRVSKISQVPVRTLQTLFGAVRTRMETLESPYYKESNPSKRRLRAAANIKAISTSKFRTAVAGSELQALITSGATRL